MESMHTKRWSLSCHQGNTHKTAARYHCTYIRITIVWDTESIKCWQERGPTGPLIHCCWESQMVQPLCVTVWWFLTALNIILLWYHSDTTLYLSKGVKNLGPHKNLHMGFYNSIIHNCQNLEATSTSFSRVVDRYTVVHLDNGILLCDKGVIKPQKARRES